MVNREVHHPPASSRQVEREQLAQAAFARAADEDAGERAVQRSVPAQDQGGKRSAWTAPFENQKLELKMADGNSNCELETVFRFLVSRQSLVLT